MVTQEIGRGSQALNSPVSMELIRSFSDELAAIVDLDDECPPALQN
jgi:hypothetical protein